MAETSKAKAEEQDDRPDRVTTVGPPNEIHIEYRALASLEPYARNSRTHTDEQIEGIVASIQEFGFTNPILTRGSMIVAGHARVSAAQLLKWDRVPVIDLNYLTAEQARAYVIADNRLAEQAGWDDSVLALEFTELEEAGYGLDLTGFDSKARDGIFSKLERESAANRREDEDDLDADIPETEIKVGDLITLGQHKLVCGDATDAAVVEQLLGAEKPNLMVTDPPYGVSLDANWRAAVQTQAERHVIPNDDRSDWTEAWELFTGNVAYVWHGGLHASTVSDNLVTAGFTIRSQIIWHKHKFAMGRSDYHWQHEPCWYAVRKGAAGGWTGSRTDSTVWDIDRIMKLELAHPNQKPVECMRKPILNNSNEGQLVYDPFAGTGTTLVACELTNRQARCIELDPVFCQIIVDRFNKLFPE